MHNLHQQRLAVFNLGLAQTVAPVLSDSSNVKYTNRAMDMSWSWIEERSVSAVSLINVCHDENDYGVEPAMYAEKDPVRKNAWGCVVEALLQTAYCAYTSEGVRQVPEILELSEAEEVFEELMRYFIGAGGETRLPDLFASYLVDQPEGHFTRAGITEVVSGLLDQIHNENA